VSLGLLTAADYSPEPHNVFQNFRHYQPEVEGQALLLVTQGSDYRNTVKIRLIRLSLTAVCGLWVCHCAGYQRFVLNL
jgi:hypothetical protein